MPVANPCRRQRQPAGLSPRPGILIFAKAPVPGRCKTRLARRYGAVRAANLYRALVEHAVAWACRQAPSQVTLCCAPTVSAAFFIYLARRYGVARIRQHPGDLGQRMHAAFTDGLRAYHSVLLMGSDQPALTRSSFEQAADWLGRPNAAFLAPTADGGYWAIGLARPEARLFRGLRWSTPRVAVQTRRRLDRAGFYVREDAVHTDIDDARDWQRLDRRLKSRLSRRASMPNYRGLADNGLSANVSPS